MTIVIRLHGLNIEAGSKDIRRFFDGLQIPEGGVHITGGSRGEAFIIFATEKDGQLAMGRSGSLLRGSPVILSLSSKAELQHKMASRLRKYKTSQKFSEKKNKELAEVCTPEHATALLLSLVTAIGSLQAKKLESTPVEPQQVKNVKSKLDRTATHEEWRKRKRTIPHQATRYVRLYGLPKSITKQEICHFFKGLHVQEVIVNARIGEFYGCLVKFAEEQDALEGLKLNRASMGSFSVEIKVASLEMWISAVEECKKSLNKCARNVCPAPVRRFPESHSRSRSPKRHRSHSPSSNEFCVKIDNIPPSTSKTEIKGFFGCSYLESNKVLHLLDKQGHRTSTAFIIFDQMRDYCSALSLNGSQFYAHTIKVSAITMTDLVTMINASKWSPRKTVNRDSTEQPRSDRPKESSYSLKSYIYVRNLPADVRKVEVKDFFCKFRISEDHITLLYDQQGVGIGEALVKFQTEDMAKMAESLNGTLFLGTNVLLTCTTRQQMEDMLHKKR